jgi:hypothetical protein
MKYTFPAVEQREATTAPYVLGTTYQNAPTWTDQPGEEDRGAS